MTNFPQREGEICINDEFQWVLDGVEIKHFSMLEIQIDGHWILGTVIEMKGMHYWSSWNDGVTVLINLGIKARRSHED